MIMNTMAVEDVAVSGGMPLSGNEAGKELKSLGEGWSIGGGRMVEREYQLKDFAQAVDFMEAVTMLATKENHHPDISLFKQNRVKVQLLTREIGGLSQQDFDMASKIDGIWRERFSA